MKSHFLKENDVVLSSRWQFEDGLGRGMRDGFWMTQVHYIYFALYSNLTLPLI